MIEFEHEGWRCFLDLDEGVIAVDNRPLTDAAKKEGKSEPEPQHAVFPVALIQRLQEAEREAHPMLEANLAGHPLVMREGGRAGWMG